MEKQISITAQATYETLGNLNARTSTIWLVCHGYGQLAKYFIRRFDVLNPAQHYVIAPQGLAKFYLDTKYEKVGASWLTKESKEMDLQNQLSYIDSVWKAEKEVITQAGLDFNKLKINVLGFSQGCAAACRWVVSRQITFSNLYVWAGLLPQEFRKEDFSYLPNASQIHFIIGKDDEFRGLLDFTNEIEKIKDLLPTAQIVSFDGGHEVKREVLASLINVEILNF
jgi:predicted esterase